MSFFDTLWEMLVILFAMAAGYLASRLEYLNGETNQRLAKVIMNITMPALIVSAVITGDSLPGPAEILSVLKAAFFSMPCSLPWRWLSPGFWAAR